MIKDNKNKLEDKIKDAELQGLSDTAFFVEVRSLFQYYTQNTHELNLNNYSELSKSYQVAIQKADINYIKGLYNSIRYKI